MVDYSCYQLSLADWHARQPPRRHREFKDWITEGRSLFEGLDALKEIAYGYLRQD